MKYLLVLSVALFAVIVGCGSDSAPASTDGASGGSVRILEQPGSGVATPDFTLPSASGEIVRLSDYRGSQPFAVIFYRGLF